MDLRHWFERAAAAGINYNNNPKAYHFYEIQAKKFYLQTNNLTDSPQINTLTD